MNVVRIDIQVSRGPADTVEEVALSVHISRKESRYLKGATLQPSLVRLPKEFRLRFLGGSP